MSDNIEKSDKQQVTDDIEQQELDRITAARSYCPVQRLHVCFDIPAIICKVS